MTVPWLEPEPATLQSLGRVAWAAVVVDSCLLKTCRNLSKNVKISGKSSAAWVEEARRVLARAADRTAAATVVAWLDATQAALDGRHAVLHGHPTEFEWHNGDDPPLPGGMGLLNRARRSLVPLDTRELDRIADRLLASIDGWEEVQDLASALRTADVLAGHGRP